MLGWHKLGTSKLRRGLARLNLRVASFVLLVVGLVPFRRARAEPPAGSSASAAPSSSVTAPGTPPPAPAAGSPGPAPASTVGYTEPLTPVYAPPYPAPQPYPSQPPFPVAKDSVSPSPLRDQRHADSHVDRVVFVPTAETHPEGTLYFSSYEIVLLQAGYAVSDRTQITLSGMPPLRNETVLPFDLTLKTVVARTQEFRAAAFGSVSGISGTELGTAVLGRAGGVVQLCFEWTCRSSVSIGSNVVLAGPAILVGNGAGVIIRASPHVSVLLEVDALIPIGNAANELHGISVAPGVRFTGEHFALDLAFAHSLDLLECPALPFLAATHRSGAK